MSDKPERGDTASEEIIELRSWRYQIFLIIVGLAGWALVSYDMNLSTVMLPLITEDLNMGPKEVGIYGMILYIAWLIALLSMGPMIDYFGRRFMYMVTLTLTAVFTAFTGFVQSFWQFAFVRGVASGTGEVEQAVGPSLTIEEFPAKWRGTLYGFVQGGYPLGYFLASGVALPFVPILGWRWVFLLGLIPLVMVIVARKWVKEPDRFEKVKEIRDAIRRGEVELAENLKKKYARLVKAEELEKFTYKQAFGIDTRRLVLVGIFTVFLNSVNWPVIDGFVVYWLSEFKNWSFQDAVTLVLLGSAVIYVFYVFCGFLGDIVGRREMIAAGGILSGLSVIGMTVAESFWPMTLLWIGAFVGNGACVWGAGMTFWTESAPTRARGTILSIILAAMAVGAIVGTGLFGLLTEAVGGIQAWVYIGAIPAFIWTVTVLLAKRVKPGTELEEIAR